MHQMLLRKLVEKAVIGTGTEIDAHYTGLDIAFAPVVKTTGNFVILEINNSSDQIVLTVADTVAGSRRTILAEQVVRVEGMIPERLAATYALGPDGSPLTAGARRGRRPKNASEDEDEDEDAFEFV